MNSKFYEFYSPVKIISGHRSIENIPFELEQLNAQNPLVITENYILSIGLVDVVLESLKNANIEVKALFSDVPTDSSAAVVNTIAEIFKKNSCDSIIAIGGGSVIDTAKGVNIVITEDANNLMDFMGYEILKKDMKPLIVVPTTAGTGSEATSAAVIADLQKNVKMTFNSYKLIPTVAVLDSSMTVTLPPKLTAATGMDALTHAIEAYSCLQKNPLSDAYSAATIKLVSENLIEAVKNGKNKTARLAMANASLMAGIAFSNSMVGIVHSIGHSLGAVAHVPHGIAMAVLLPHCMKFNLMNADSAEQNYSQILLYLCEERYIDTLKPKRALEAIKVIQELVFDLNKLCDIPTTLKAAGVAKEQLDKIARVALNDGSLNYNPTEAGYDDIINILTAAYE